jgi:ergothioneine biosynthesis protein EgtB
MPRCGILSLVACLAAVYAPSVSESGTIIARVLGVRKATTGLTAPLGPEDLVVQSMPDTSPAKWHLAHTSWFFDRFVLQPLGMPPVHADYDYLFNSYYDAVGARHPRSARGLLTRPTSDEVFAYRRAVDARLADLEGSAHVARPEVAAALELGLHHEQQHQELILTDIKHLFAANPLFPAYDAKAALETAACERAPAGPLPPLAWIAGEGGVREIGHDGEGFAFDNERPRHKVYVAPFSFASRLVTNDEYLGFVRDGGYRRPELWLSEGWAWVQAHAAHAPLYWVGELDSPTPPTPPRVFTLGGLRDLVPHAPVLHVSYYEADAYARWAKARLPTETEWELAASDLEGVEQAFGHAWQWTQSAYAAYPGFRPLAGAFGEYNGKFMVSQMVLRGSSCATPQGHARITYRNFFPPSAQWQLSGIRLARET